VRAVVGETWKRSAARRSGQSSSTMQRARRSRPVGVRGALAWVMRVSGGSEQMSQSTPNREALTSKIITSCVARVHNFPGQYI
jgi:hypothetical protein